MSRTPKRPATTRTKSSGKASLSSGTSKSLNKLDKAMQSKVTKVQRDEEQDSAKGRSKSKKKRGASQDTKVLRSGKQFVEDLINEVEDTQAREMDEAATRALSKFHQDFSQLRAALAPEHQDTFRVEASSLLFYKASLGMIMDLIPIAEDAYRTSKKESAAYAVAAMVNLGRELNTDIKMADDISSKTLILNSVLGNGFKMIADTLIREQQALLSRLDSQITKSRHKVAIKSETNDMIRSLGRAITSVSELTKAQMEAFLMGDPNYLNPGAPIETPKKKRRKKA